MSCLRVSCHPLQIERRRYHKPTPIPANERYCPLCLQRKLEMVKDEAHFMIECESYIEERRRYHRPTPIPANERYCPLCLQTKLEMVKDEAHFKIECESCIEERCLLFDAAVAHHPSLTYLDVELQMILLLCSWNLSKIMSVSKFVRLKCNTGILVKV